MVEDFLFEFESHSHILQSEKERYWENKNNWQKEKHNIIKHYLDGYFPKLGWSKRIQYIDTHAGRGKHTSGELGSPLVALETLLNHSYFPQCEQTKFIFYFIEKDPDNISFLREALNEYNPLPKNVECHTIEGNCFEILKQMTSYFDSPTFIFIDPFGFKIPGGILCELMNITRVELFINIIWRELDMAICQKDKPKNMNDTLDYIFDGINWKEEIIANDPDERADQAAELFRKITRSLWYTYVKMLGDNRKTRYFLLHLTNHNAGRDLMKTCIWNSCPEGIFHVKKFENPDQLYLIEKEPDLIPLEEWLISRLNQKQFRWKELLKDLREEIWLEKHLNGIIRSLRNHGIIDGKDFEKTFSAKSNPVLYLK